MVFRQVLRNGIPPALKLFLQHSAVVTLIRVTGLVIVFCLQILLARLIGSSEEYGKYAWGQSILFMAGTLAAMGVPVATSRFIASLNTSENEHAVAAVVYRARRLLSWSFCILLLLALGMLIAGRTITNYSMYLNLSAVALVFAPGVSLLLLYQHMSRARHWLFLAFLPMQVLRPTATALLAVSAWWLLGDSLSGALTLILVGLSVFAASVIQASIFHSRQGNLLAGAQYSASHSQEYHPAELSRTALPIFVTRIASVTIEYSNVLLVGFLAGPAQAGAYFAAEKLAQLALIPPSIMSSVCQPDLAAANATRNPQLLKSISRRAIHGGLWPTVTIGLISIILAGPLLSLFGENFTSATPVLVILILGLILKTALGPVEDLLLMTGNQQVLPRVMVITAIFHLLSLSVLVPLHGAAGAALTSAFSGLLSSFWLMRLVKDKLAINPTILAGRN